MYILDTQDIFNFAVQATGRQNLFTVKSDVITLYLPKNGKFPSTP